VIDLQSVLVSPQPAQVRPQTAANNNGTTVNTLKQLFEEIIGQHSFVRGKPLLLLLNNKSPQSSTTSANARLDKIKRLLEDTLALGSIVPTEEWLYLQECGGETMQSLRNRIESNKTPVRIIIQECSLKGLFSANNMPDISMDFHQLQIIPVDERAQQQKQQPPRRVGNSNKVEPISRPATAAAVDTANNVSDALTSIDPRLKRALWVLMAAVQSRRGELEERIKQDSLEQRRLYAQERYDRKRQLNLLQQQERQQKTAGI
jgi:hypothetical protein